MENQHVGTQSIAFARPPYVLETASAGGLLEQQGPLGKSLDIALTDEMNHEDSWEKAESQMVLSTIRRVIQKSGLDRAQIQYIFAGDLMNQLTASGFAMRELAISFFGLYGACSTMGESMQLASMAVAGGYASYAVAEASSHFCAAEKQFRQPLAYGGQKPLYASRTVMGSGSVLIGYQGKPKAKITGITTGRVIDFGIKDSNNMGASMAPAAAHTICQHLNDFQVGPEEYDRIFTGDLGEYGLQLTKELVERDGYRPGERLSDCGMIIYDRENQDVHAGGSGCGCSAVTLINYIIPGLQSGKFKKVLFIPTGALLSPLSTQQGESIPGVAHALVLEAV
ncbi:MAG: stage V sporulation protein AD [Firmicutes bacterium]|nr:stage V sporulation protein AD [Bacillota bacterium]